MLLLQNATLPKVNTMKKSLKRIFFIYSEATLAVFFAAMSLLEVACYFAIPSSVSFAGELALGAAIGFALMTVVLVNVIYRNEKRNSINII
jgi:hypothetical protein